MPHADKLAARLVLTSCTACTLQSHDPTPVPESAMSQTNYTHAPGDGVGYSDGDVGWCAAEAAVGICPNECVQAGAFSPPTTGLPCTVGGGTWFHKQRAGVCTGRPPGPWWAQPARGASRWTASAAARPTPSPPPRSRPPARVPAAAARPAAPLRGGPVRLLRRAACAAHRAFGWHDYPTQVLTLPCQVYLPLLQY